MVSITRMERKCCVAHDATALAHIRIYLFGIGVCQKINPQGSGSKNTGLAPDAQKEVPSSDHMSWQTTESCLATSQQASPQLQLLQRLQVILLSASALHSKMPSASPGRIHPSNSMTLSLA